MDRLSEVFGALADPTRRAILARLAEGEATVNQLAEPFPISLQAVSKHLKVLERAGLVTRGKAAQWRPCRLEAGPLRDAAGWIVEYQRFWAQRYDRLGEYLDELQSGRLRPEAQPEALQPEALQPGDLHADGFHGSELRSTELQSSELQSGEFQSSRSHEEEHDERATDDDDPV